MNFNSFNRFMPAYIFLRNDKLFSYHDVMSLVSLVMHFLLRSTLSHISYGYAFFGFSLLLLPP